MARTRIQWLAVAGERDCTFGFYIKDAYLKARQWLDITSPSTAGHGYVDEFFSKNGNIETRIVRHAEPVEPDPAADARELAIATINNLVKEHGIAAWEITVPEHQLS